MPTGEHSKGKFNEQSVAWKGDAAGYMAKHKWLSKNYDKGEYCELCKKKSTRLDWANISGNYLRKREDYIVLCHACHLAMDFNKSHCVRGHEMTAQNIYSPPHYPGRRRCRTCRKLDSLRDEKVQRNKRREDALNKVKLGLKTQQWFNHYYVNRGKSCKV